MRSKEEKEIMDSWHLNAMAWTKAIQKEEIKSRISTTNIAIMDVVIELRPESVLDIGCGEGWLSREMVERGIDVLGIDIVLELIEEAKKSGAGRYQLMSYQDLVRGALSERFDVAVCNFSLLGDQSVSDLFGSFAEIVNRGGHVVVQTLHPQLQDSNYEYQDGWREGSWEGFSDDFVRAPPWYFRTLETWLRLFEQNHIEIVKQYEPIDPRTGEYASVVFVGGV